MPVRTTAPAGGTAPLGRRPPCLQLALPLLLLLFALCNQAAEVAPELSDGLGGRRVGEATV